MSWTEREERRYERREMTKTFAKPIFVTILVILLLVVLGVACKIIFFPVNTALQSIDMAQDVVSNALNADEAKYNYEWFKSQEAYIRQCLKNEEIARKQWEDFKAQLSEKRDNWAKEDKAEESSMRASIEALEMLTNKAIEDYNARSSMVNRAIFKDSLPTNITRALYAGKELIK